jgi:hypothetical protein
MAQFLPASESYPNKIEKALFISSQHSSPEEKNVISYLTKEKNYSLLNTKSAYENIKKKSNKILEYIYSYIEKNSRGEVSYCTTINKTNQTTVGMNTEYLLKTLNDFRDEANNITVMVCYDTANESQPLIVLLYKYDYEGNFIYIISVCADQTIRESKGFGSEMIGDLIEAVNNTDIGSIYLDSVESAVKSYEKKGFIETGETNDGLFEMVLTVDKKGGRRSNRTKRAKKAKKAKRSMAKRSMSKRSLRTKRKYYSIYYTIPNRKR